VKKVLTASIASLLLLAGVAAAETDSAVIHVGDRLGSSSETINQDQGSPVPLYIAGGVVLIVIIAVAASQHSRKSVSP